MLPAGRTPSGHVASLLSISLGWRKLRAAKDDHPRLTAWILLQIGRIYRIEARLRDQRAGPLERQRIRWLETRRIYEHLPKLFTHLHKHRRHILPKSNLGKALHYALDQWQHLEPRFLDGQVEFGITSPRTASAQPMSA